MTKMFGRALDIALAFKSFGKGNADLTAGR
jgi:hypothetical protein